MIHYIKEAGRPRMKYTLITSMVLFGLMGCASNESLTLVEEYAKQSTEVQEALLGVYVSADEARINAELVKATRDGATGKDLDIATIDNAGQEALLKNLQDFSQSVYLLSTDDRGEELDKYSDKLNSSLISLSENVQSDSIDAKDVEILTTSVNAIARAYTERTRYKLLKQVVIDSEPVIQSSFDSLKGELGSWKEATRVSLEQELRIRLYLLNNPNRCEQVTDTRCVAFTHSLEERVGAYKKAYEIRSRLNGLDEKFTKLDQALNGIQKSNLLLVTSLKQDDDISKEALKRAFKTTKKQIDAIKDFRDSLED